ncbi:Cell wall surface anchor family protein [Bacillus mycoides]|uniref:SpaA isopeptide-forming pilin-related protein n=1 Tax=Bacillus mycoides TaxID=1405 RepID=UPI0005CB67CE|nr:SpaA isopeptide-forming pilin-related protein [Bacillus mycoides]KIV72269.1 Cell wall surface anchor family protein [Bacillus mycoides]
MVGAFKRSRTLSTIFSIISVLVLTISMFLPQSPVQAEVMEGNNEIKGSLKITTTDDDRKPLEGVEFTVYKDGKEFGKVVTNKDGIAELKNLPFGDYTFTQTKGLEGYTVYPFEKKLTISKDWAVHDFKIGNSKIKGLLRVFKTDRNKNPLEGVEFTLYDANGKEMQKLITNKDGQASKELPYGNYSVKETKALEGYIAPENTYYFEIDVQNKGCDYVLINRLVKGNIQITKVDDEGRPLGGVEFTVYNKDGNEITKVVTDKDGQASIKDLTYGKYSFKETKTKPGYVANDEETPFEVKEDGKTQKFNVVNKLIKDNIEINVKGDNQKPLAGVELGVYDLTDKEITKVVTDKDGQASVKELPYGSYYFKETKTVEGYLINTDKTTFTVKENGKIQKFDVVNKLIKGNIEIHKVGDNKQPLEGVEFTIYDEKGRELIQVITDKNGIAKSGDLPYGSYYFKETKAKTGYVINNQKFDFNIEENAKTLPFTVTNKLIKGNVKLVKVDADNQDIKLKGAVYELFDATNEKVGEYTTNENGEIAVENLVYGSYKFVEKEAPTDYVLDRKEIPFEVKENGRTIELTATNTEQPKPEQPKPEQPKPEQPKPEQPKPEQPKPEQPKPEQPKPEQPKPEQPKPEQPKPEQPKPEQPKPEQPLPQTGGTDNSMKYTILGLTIILLSGLIFVLAKRKKHN